MVIADHDHRSADSGRPNALWQQNLHARRIGHAVVIWFFYEAVCFQIWHDAADCSLISSILLGLTSAGFRRVSRGLRLKLPNQIFVALRSCLFLPCPSLSLPVLTCFRPFWFFWSRSSATNLSHSAARRSVRSDTIRVTQGDTGGDRKVPAAMDATKPGTS